MRLGMGELLIILFIILILFGATRLPEIAKALGKSISEFKKGAKELKESEKEEPKDDSAAGGK